MSFLSDRKGEITEEFPKSACCRRAMLYGVLFAKAELSPGNTTVSIETQETAEFIAALVKEFFGKEPEISTPKKGGRRRLLAFRSPAAEKHLLSLDAGETSYFKEKCSFCRTAFLRGIFLACARVTDPEKQYRLELAPSKRLFELSEFLSEMGISFSVAERRNERLLYTSNSTEIEDFFAAMGMNSTAFLLMNSKIKNEFKNTANRIRNCETNNILKTVSAAARWIDAIEALDRANLLSTLPEELEKTARMRIEFKDYSLARLAAEFTPPISKPGLSHRLNKIVELSETLLSKK